MSNEETHIMKIYFIKYSCSNAKCKFVIIMKPYTGDVFILQLHDCLQKDKEKVKPDFTTQ